MENTNNAIVELIRLDIPAESLRQKASESPLVAYSSRFEHFAEETCSSAAKRVFYAGIFFARQPCKIQVAWYIYPE